MLWLYAPCNVVYFFSRLVAFCLCRKRTVAAFFCFAHIDDCEQFTRNNSIIKNHAKIHRHTNTIYIMQRRRVNNYNGRQFQQRQIQTHTSTSSTFCTNPRNPQTLEPRVHSITIYSHHGLLFDYIYTSNTIYSPRPRHTRIPWLEHKCSMFETVGLRDSEHIYTFADMMRTFPDPIVQSDDSSNFTFALCVECVCV